MVRIANLAKRSAFMSHEKYIGMDVHQATVSVTVVQRSQASALIWYRQEVLCADPC
jgi:hypothetical protein